MPDATTTAEPACASPPPKAAKPNPFGDRMLALVRDLIAYGRDMLASLQACEGPHLPT